MTQSLLKDVDRRLIYDPSDGLDNRVGPPALLEVLWRRKRIVVLCILVCIGASCTYLRLATPVYQSTARVTVEQNGVKVSGDSQGFVQQSEGFLQTQADGFQSTPVLRRALDSVGYQKLQTFAAVSTDPIAWLKRSGALKVDVPRKSDVITVSMESPYPAEAALIANAVVAAYVAEQSQFKRSTGAQIILALESERDQTRVRRDARTKRMVDLKRENRVLSFKDDPHTNPVLERAAMLAASLANAEASTVELRAQRDALNAALADPTAISAFIEAQQLKVKESGDREYDELRSQLGQASLSLMMGMQSQGPNHPRVISLQSVVDAVHKRLEDKESMMARAHLLSIATQLNAAESKEQSLREALRLQQDHALELNPASVEYAQLEAEATQLGKQLDVIDSRIAEVHVNTASVNNLDIRVIEPARAEERPVKPGRALTLAAAMLAGCMLGTGLALVREHRDGRLRNAHEILARLGVPVIATVPQMNPRLSPVVRGQVVGLDAQSIVAEAYRAVRTSLYLGVGGEARTILVASAAQGDGKSTTASNLAIAFAQSGERTLLLDGDLRQPVQHMIFEMDNSTGLTSAMSGEMKLSDAIRPTPIPGLHLLSCGPVPAAPSELLSSKSFKRLMRVLVRTFDRIIIDSPPLIRFTDATVLAASADVTLLVLRMNQSMRPLCEMALGRLEHVGARVLGAIANAGPSDGSAYYGRAWQYASPSSAVRLTNTPWSAPDAELETAAVVRQARSPMSAATDEPVKLRKHITEEMVAIPDSDWLAES